MTVTGTLKIWDGEKWVPFNGVVVSTLGNVLGTGSATDGHLVVFNADGYHLKDGGPVPAAGGDVYGSSSVTDGHIVLFDGDGYHLKDGGSPSAGAGYPPAWKYDPDMPPESPDAMDDEFDAGSLDGKWTQTLASGTNAVISFAQSKLIAKISPAATNHYRQHEWVQAVPGATWRFRAKMIFESVTWDFIGAMLTARNGGTGNEVAAGLVCHSSYGGEFSAYKLAVNGESFAGEAEGADTKSNIFYLEIESDGTTLTWRQSTTGTDGTFVDYFTETIASYIGAVTQVGIYFHMYTGATYPACVSCEWFRRMA